MPPVLLGLGPKVADARNIQYRAVAAMPWPTLPLVYSWDGEHPGAVPLPMFVNDQLGCCVISGRAHHTLRFEFNEQGVAIPITDAEVKREYLTESGGADSGLVLLYSLRDWRNKGWMAGGKHYRIHSFLEVNPRSPEEIKEATIVGLGIQYGIRLPLSAADQRNAGQIWDTTSGPRAQVGSWGGHLVHGCEYDPEGVTVETWGSKQKMTWRFIRDYCDEAYMVIDDVNSVRVADSISAARIEALLPRDN